MDIEQNREPHRLNRFIEAQHDIYEMVLAELQAGRKQTHWMWFVFPQIAGLGSSKMAVYYAIKDITEAKAYLHHPVLGPRLYECAEELMSKDHVPVTDIFSYPDDLKFCSSMTLFEIAAPGKSPFENILLKYFAGQRDEKTLSLLQSARG